MFSLPRLAVGTLDQQASPQAVTWALFGYLRLMGLQVQSYQSRAAFARHRTEAALVGRPPRHLDSWLMGPDVCRDLFIRGSVGADVSVVVGQFSADRRATLPGGSLDTLCDWLDLPRVAVLDARRSDPQALPARRGDFDAVLLDNVTEPAEFERLAQAVDCQWGVPVCGGLEPSDHRCSDVSTNGDMRVLNGDLLGSADDFTNLAQAFARYARPQPLLDLAARRPLAWLPRRIGEPQPSRKPIIVALAHDQALNCYFPDTLDALEAGGARLVDFSPLKDDRLPEGTDVVYLGCGHPERFGAELAANHCMKLALRNFVRTGGRIYSECGGLAYLCEQLVAPSGEAWPMVGIFPAAARLHAPSGPPDPVEVTLSNSTWVGPSGSTLRGYRNSAWTLEPLGRLVGCAADPGCSYDIVRCYRALGSLLHLNFALAPPALSTFFNACLPPTCKPEPWASVV